MTKSRILLALGLSLVLAAPSVTFAAMPMSGMAAMPMSGMMADMMDKAKAAPADHMAMMMDMAEDATYDADFWLKCTFHKTDACDEAMAMMMHSK